MLKITGADLMVVVVGFLIVSCAFILLPYLYDKLTIYLERKKYVRDYITAYQQEILEEEEKYRSNPTYYHNKFEENRNITKM